MEVINKKRKYSETSIETWNEGSIIDWLWFIGMNKYASQFLKYSISGNELITLTPAKLFELIKIDVKEHKYILTKEINKLKGYYEEERKFACKANLLYFLNSTFKSSILIDRKTEEIHGIHKMQGEHYGSILELDNTQKLRFKKCWLSEVAEKAYRFLGVCKRRWKCRKCKYTSNIVTTDLKQFGEPPACPVANEIAEEFQGRVEEIKDKTKGWVATRIIR